MPAEIILQARKENEVVIEGEVHLVIDENTPSDIVIEVPNQNGRLLSKEMLSNNTLVSSDTIKRPIILVPENNSIGFTGTFVLSPYEPSETYSGVPTGMRIEISATEDFSMIMKNVVIDELLSEVPVTFEESSEVLYARVKYVSDSHVSGYSDVVKFTNSDFYVYQPKILTPTMDATGVARTPFIQVSDYQYMGNENYYAGLTYEVATDSNFTNVVETDTVGSPNTGESGSSNGVYLNNFIVNTILDEDTIYYVRVKYLGVNYPASPWSDVVSFRTFDIEEKIVNYTLSNASNYVSMALKSTPEYTIYLFRYFDVAESTNSVILKISNNGDILIAKKFYHTTATSEYLRDCVIDTAENVYVIGYTNLGGGYKAYVAKLDSNLSLLSQKTILLANTVSILANTIILDGDNLVISGKMMRSGYGYINFLVKLNLSLNIVSQKLITPFIASTNIDVRLKKIGAEYILITDHHIIRMDTNLNILVDRHFNLTGYIHSFIDLHDTNGNIFVIGTLLNNTTSIYDIICYKLDYNLNIIKQVKITEQNNHTFFVFLTDVDSEGNLILSGRTGETPFYSNFIIKIDTNLNIVTSKKIYSNTQQFFTQIVNNGDYYNIMSYDGISKVSLLTLHKDLQFNNDELLYGDTKVKSLNPIITIVNNPYSNYTVGTISETMTLGTISTLFTNVNVINEINII
jgi:hypothetical protein